MAEDHARPFIDIWTGDGSIQNSGDAETMTLETDDIMTGEMVYIGVNNIEILIDNYQTGSGHAPTREYKNGSTEQLCNDDIWNDYTAPFESAGYIKIRVVN